MIYAQMTIALVQSLGFASEMRLALRGDGLSHGNNLDARDWLNDLSDRLFPPGLPLLRLRFQSRFAGFSGELTARSRQRSESHSLRQSGRERWWYFASSAPC